MAVEIAVIHNFLWHERFTWADRPAGRPMQSLVRLAKVQCQQWGGFYCREPRADAVAGWGVEAPLCHVQSCCDCRVFAGEFPAWRSVCVRCRGEPGGDFDVGISRALLGLDGRGARPHTNPGTWPLVRFWGLRRDQTRDILLIAAMRSNGYISPLQTAGSRDALVPAGIFPFCLRTCAPISLAATNFPLSSLSGTHFWLRLLGIPP